MANLSPDCTAGKHTACRGDAYDNDADQPTDCSCSCHHQARCACPTPTRPISPTVLPHITRSLASVGGVYDFVSAAVTHHGGHQPAALAGSGMQR